MNLRPPQAAKGAFMHPHAIEHVYQQLHAGFKSAVKELAAKLCSLGYADTTVSFYEQGAVHFSFWLANQRIGPSQVKREPLRRFPITAFLHM